MLSKDLEATLNYAFKGARKKRHEFMTVEHLLLALLDNEVASSVLLACDCDLGRLRGERQRLERTSAAVGAAMNNRAFWAGSLRAASEVSVRLTMAVVIAVGLYQLKLGNTTPGQILAAVSVIALLTGPIRDISRAYEY